MDKFITNSFQETQKVGEDFAKEILTSGLKNSAVVLALQGDLGAGKTTFLQGFAKGLGIKEKILSPTFILMKKFKIVQRLTLHYFKNFYHIDCYRLENKEDLEMLGIKEIISDPKNIVAIEWPEKIKDLLSKNTIEIKFNHLEENKRELTISR